MTNRPTTVGCCTWYDPDVTFGAGVVIHHGSCVGLPCTGESECSVGDGTRIGAFCAISMGAELGKNVELDPYCRVDDARVGDGARLLYGARVHSEAKVGEGSLIAGNVPDRTVIGRRVKHFGRLVHIPRGEDWDNDKDPSPRIGDDVFIGAGALVVGGVTIEDGVNIGAGATIIGDGVVIGRESKISAMSVVRCSVPPDPRAGSGAGGHG